MLAGRVAGTRSSFACQRSIQQIAEGIKATLTAHSCAASTTVCDLAHGDSKQHERALDLNTTNPQPMVATETGQRDPAHRLMSSGWLFPWDVHTPAARVLRVANRYSSATQGPAASIGVSSQSQTVFKLLCQ